MKDQGKIILYGLPPALEAALARQLAGEGLPVGMPETGAEGLRGASLVVYGGGARPAAAPGVPALSLNLQKPQRLGIIVRQAQQILAEPALYLDEFDIGPYLFRPAERTLSDASREIALTDKEADILVFLAARQGAAVARDELLRHVWRYQEGVDTHTLETHIYRLRQKIEAEVENPALLLTEEGGYRLNF